MLVRIKLILLVKSIVAINWLLSQLTTALVKESIIQIADTNSPARLIFIDEKCYLDECYDEDVNGRASLSMWKYRIKADD